MVLELDFIREFDQIVKNFNIDIAFVAHVDLELTLLVDDLGFGEDGPVFS